MKNRALFSSALILSMVGGATPGIAKRPPPPPPPVTLPPPPLPVSGVDPAVLSAVDRFNAVRAQPLWFSQSMPTPAALALLARVKTSDIDGYRDGPGMAARIEAALALPGRTRDADRMLSAAYLMMVHALAGPSKGLRYADEGARPILDSDDRLLALAAQAPDLDAHLRSAFRRTDIYERLRATALSAARLPDGRLDPRLAANLDRARLIPPTGRVLVVNPAAAELLMIEDGRIADRMRVVVGLRETPTYPMASMLRAVTVNPYWNVPSDLVQKILAPRIASQGLAYLKRARYEVVDSFGRDAVVMPASSVDWPAVSRGTAKVQVRQLPGPYNSMGRLKFGFENELGIYLHDTPNKPQFAEADRVHSNGCIRLEDAPRLARWLLGRDPEASGDHGDELVAIGTPVPLYISYLTAQPSAGGVQWLPDIYGYDPRVPGMAPPPPPAAPAVETPVMVDPLAPTEQT